MVRSLYNLVKKSKRNLSKNSSKGRKSLKNSIRKNSKVRKSSKSGSRMNKVSSVKSKKGSKNNSRRVRKMNKSNKMRNKTHKRNNKRNHKRNMRGGTVLPSEYFGRNSGNYHAVGSSALSSCPRQFARSHGVIHADGKFAGPILHPKQ